MTRKAVAQQSRRHVWIFDGDWKYLVERFGVKLGPSKCVRDILHSWVARLREAENVELSKRPAATSKASEAETFAMQDRALNRMDEIEAGQYKGDENE